MRKRRRNKTDYIFIGEGGIITADSIPDLDEWGIDDYWSCNDWITWHKAVTQKYGLDNANLVFAKFWNEQTFGAHALGCRTVDSEFRQYVASVGLYEIVWKGAGGLKYLLQPVGAVMQTGGSIGTQVLQGLQTTSKGLGIIVPLLAFGTVGLLLVYGYRKATKSKV